jgi:hypothetical protein
MRRMQLRQKWSWFVLLLAACTSDREDPEDVADSGSMVHADAGDSDAAKPNPLSFPEDVCPSTWLAEEKECVVDRDCFLENFDDSGFEHGACEPTLAELQAVICRGGEPMGYWSLERCADVIEVHSPFFNYAYGTGCTYDAESEVLVGASLGLEFGRYCGDRSKGISTGGPHCVDGEFVATSDLCPDSSDAGAEDAGRD